LKTIAIKNELHYEDIVAVCCQVVYMRDMKVKRKIFPHMREESEAKCNNPAELNLPKPYLSDLCRSAWADGIEA
jgi:hypothetical protein